MKKILIAGCSTGMSHLLKQSLCRKAEMIIYDPLKNDVEYDDEQMAQDIVSITEIHDRDYKAQLKYTIKEDAPRLPGSFKHRSRKR